MSITFIIFESIAATAYRELNSSVHKFIHEALWVNIRLSSVCLSIYVSIYPQSCWTLVAFSVSRSFYTVGSTPWTRDQHAARQLPTHRTGQTQNTPTQTSMPQVRFEPTVLVFERTKTVHALDHAASVIGGPVLSVLILKQH
jgi:hypothetical protein